MLTIIGDYGILAHNYTIMAKPIKSLELHYPMIQLLITYIMLQIIISLQKESNSNTLFFRDGKRRIGKTRLVILNCSFVLLTGEINVMISQDLLL